MQATDFYNETKWCATCNDYVHYLLTMDHSFCVQCGDKVRLFSDSDWQDFNESVAARKPKGGRPRKSA